jgi:hypothetical protein
MLFINDLNLNLSKANAKPKMAAPEKTEQTT